MSPATAASALIHVAPVDSRLTAAVRALQVTPAQQPYVGDVVFNLADAERDPLSEAMAVLADEAVIGFYRLDFAARVITGRRLGEPSLGLRAMLIDRRLQGRGFGVRAMRACCRDVRERHPQFRLLVLAAHCGNCAALASYRRAGFVDTGERLPGGDAGPQQLLQYRLQACLQDGPHSPSSGTRPS